MNLYKNFKKLVIVYLIFQIQQTAFAQSMLPIPPDYEYSPTNIKEIENDIPPTPILRIRNDSGNIDQLLGTTATTFTFDGNGSYDEETPQYYLEVRFDFENDGKVDTYFSTTKTAEHKYSTPGLKTIKMEVLDKAGNVSEITKTIYVAENEPPNAYFTISPNKGTPGTVFKLNTKLSSDSQYDKRLLQYRFDFDGDGKYDTKFSSKKYYEHKFKNPGIKKVTLEVKDPEGATATYTQSVNIIQNTAPHAKFKKKLIRKDSKVSVYEFDASDSYDAEDKKLQYKWDFNYTGKNDIQWDTYWYSSAKTIAYFYKKGIYLIRLLIKDKDGATAEHIMKISPIFDKSN
jgi:PKD repeat protein